MSITLVCISNINHNLTEFAINKSFANMRFDDNFIMSDRILNGIRYKHQFFKINDVIQMQNEEGQNVDWNYDVYNIFLLKHLADHIKTDHIINIHYDGFCINQNFWTDEYLEYDYIGSPTYKDWTPLANSLKDHDLYDIAPNGWYNGGGGFSLRSKKLLLALKDERIDTTLSNKNYQRCEDATISIKFRKLLEQDYGIKFAPMRLSLQFSTELLTGLPFSFGFHGWTNIPLFLSENECIWYLDNLNRRDIFKGSEMVKRYKANCVINDYYKAIAHIEFIVNSNAIIKDKHSKYSR